MSVITRAQKLFIYSKSEQKKNNERTKEQNEIDYNVIFVWILENDLLANLLKIIFQYFFNILVFRFYVQLGTRTSERIGYIQGQLDHKSSVGNFYICSFLGYHHKTLT